VSGYTQGRDVEYAVIASLKEDGYDTIRGASSKGLADVVAIKPGQVLLVNVKRTTPPGPKERSALLRVASHLPGVALPLVALGPASRLTFRRLTGCEASAWVPWTADEVGR
jgi:Archaeal holliday junction resolvase (hjc)